MITLMELVWNSVAMEVEESIMAAIGGVRVEGSVVGAGVVLYWSGLPLQVVGLS